MRYEHCAKLRQMLAVIVGGWLLMTPPLVKGTFVVDVTAPFSQWKQWNIPFKTYASKRDCEEMRNKVLCPDYLAGNDSLTPPGCLLCVPNDQPVSSGMTAAREICTSVCLSSDDPRLKKAKK